MNGSFLQLKLEASTKQIKERGLMKPCLTNSGDNPACDLRDQCIAIHHACVNAHPAMMNK
jgi:hypothetical protein